MLHLGSLINQTRESGAETNTLGSCEPGLCPKRVGSSTQIDQRLSLRTRSTSTSQSASPSLYLPYIYTRRTGELLNHKSNNSAPYGHSLTLGAHAQEGCLSVCLLPLSCQHRSFLRSKYGTYGTRLGFPSFLTRRLSKKTSVRKLWREKANMQMSSYRSVSSIVYTLVGIYLQVAYWVSDRFLARFVHRGCCYGVYY